MPCGGDGDDGGAVGERVQTHRLDDGPHEPHALAGPGGPDGEERGPEEGGFECDAGGAAGVGVARIVVDGRRSSPVRWQVVRGTADGQVPYAGGVGAGGGALAADGVGERGEPVGPGVDALPGAPDPGVVDVARARRRGSPRSSALGSGGPPARALRSSRPFGGVARGTCARRGWATVPSWGLTACQKGGRDDSAARSPAQWPSRAKKTSRRPRRGRSRVAGAMTPRVAGSKRQESGRAVPAGGQIQNRPR